MNYFQLKGSPTFKTQNITLGTVTVIKILHNVMYQLCITDIGADYVGPKGLEPPIFWPRLIPQ